MYIYIYNTAELQSIDTQVYPAPTPPAVSAGASTATHAVPSTFVTSRVRLMRSGRLKTQMVAKASRCSTHIYTNVKDILKCFVAYLTNLNAMHMLSQRVVDRVTLIIRHNVYTCSFCSSSCMSQRERTSVDSDTQQNSVDKLEGHLKCNRVRLQKLHRRLL